MVDRESVLIVGAGHLGAALVADLPALGVRATLWPGRREELFAPGAVVPPGSAVVIDAAGRTDVGWCEANAAEAYRSNAIESLLLARRHWRAWGEAARFVRISSGCVWDGPYRTDGAPFEPDDPPEPVAVYAWAKALGDAALLAETPLHAAATVLRPRLLYSGRPHPRNFLHKLCAYTGAVDTPNSVTSVRTVARTIAELVRRDTWGGVLCVYDRGVTSPYEAAMALSRAGLRPPPVRIDLGHLNATVAPRRVHVVMHDSRFESLVRPDAVAEEIARCVEGLRQASGSTTGAA